jgi:hypothetical protein
MDNWLLVRSRHTFENDLKVVDRTQADREMVSHPGCD